MEKSQELIGILQAISIVAKSLAAKLMQIEKEVEAYEAAKAGHRQESEERMGALMRKKVFFCSPFRGDMKGMRGGRLPTAAWRVSKGSAHLRRTSYSAVFEMRDRGRTAARHRYGDGAARPL